MFLKYFNAEDASQIAIGALAVSMPIAFTQEAWDMASNLGLLNIFGLVFISVALIAHYVYASTFRSQVEHRFKEYLLRIVVAYAITLFVVAVLLLLLDKFPILHATDIAVKRLIIIATPASLGAIIVDSLDKE